MLRDGYPIRQDDANVYNSLQNSVIAIIVHLHGRVRVSDVPGGISTVPIHPGAAGNEDVRITHDVILWRERRRSVRPWHDPSSGTAIAAGGARSIAAALAARS